MAETVRQMVVRLTMDAGGFRRARTDIQGQIRNLDRELRGLGKVTDNTGQKTSLLQEKLSLQQSAVENLKGAVQEAQTNLDNAKGSLDELAKAKQLSNLETQLANAQENAKKTATELEELERKANALKFTEFGNRLTNLGRRMTNLGRKMNLFITAPILALGGKSYDAFKRQEDAFVSMQKTVDETDTTKYEDLSDSFQEMSQTIPVSYENLMGLAQVAGAMGVDADNIEKVVDTTARLSVSLDGIDGQTAAQQMAQILNVTEGGPQNIDLFGAALVALGNNFPTLEGDILNFVDRTKNAGTLVGMTTAEIVGMSAGFAAMGIRSEAGGTAVSRVLQEMQKAVELGGNAMRTFAEDSALAEMSIRDLQMASQDGEWTSAMAAELGLTNKEFKAMVDNLIQLDHFSTLTGQNMESFSANWSDSAADTMLDFFVGLSEVNLSEAGESVVTWLDKMGLDNVRIAQILQGAALNPQLMADAMKLSTEEYANGMALYEESNKKFSTTLAQDEMMMNQMENNMANLGENVGSAIEPVKEAIARLMESFSELSEVDQDKIVAVLGAFALAGPALSGLGTLAKFGGGVAKAFGFLAQNSDQIVSVFTSMVSSPLFAAVAGGAAIFALIQLLEAIPSDTDRIVENLSNIEIKIDEASKDATLAAIREVREATEGLSGERAASLKGTVAAVKAGYGTYETFGHAIGFEQTEAQQSIDRLTREFGIALDDLNQKIAHAVQAGNTGLADSLDQERVDLTSAYEIDVAEVKRAFTASVSDMVDGMMEAQPEAKAMLEQAAKEFDLLGQVQETWNSISGGEHSPDEVDNMLKNLLTQDVIDTWFADGSTFDSLTLNPHATLTQLSDKIMSSLADTTSFVADGTLGNTLLSAVMGDPATWEMLDVTGVTGALDGLIETIDLKGAAERALEDGGHIGENITLGLADGLEAGSESVTGKADEIKDAFLTNFKAAFIIQSPSQLMAEQGGYIVEGLAQGIDDSAILVYAAMEGMGNQLIDQAAEIGIAMSRAFSDNIKLELPQITAGVTGNSSIDGILRGLTDAWNRGARGFGK